MEIVALDQRNLERFFSKVSGEDGCHTWQGTMNTYGYGHFVVSKKIYRAHRLAYMIAHGSIADGMQIDHTCHNRACVNPEHLRETTHKQNQENRSGARRTSKSGIRGVYWDSQRNKWGTCITHNNKRISVGRFESLDGAEKAVIQKRRELFTHNDVDNAS